MIDTVHVDNQEAGFIAVRDAIQKLMDQGYKAVDVRTSQDENGNFMVTVLPIEEKVEDEEEK